MLDERRLQQRGQHLLLLDVVALALLPNPPGERVGGQVGSLPADARVDEHLGARERRGSLGGCVVVVPHVRVTRGKQVLTQRFQLPEARPPRLLLADLVGLDVQFAADGSGELPRGLHGPPFRHMESEGLGEPGVHRDPQGMDRVVARLLGRAAALLVPLQHRQRRGGRDLRRPQPRLQARHEFAQPLDLGVQRSAPVQALALVLPEVLLRGAQAHRGRPQRLGRLPGLHVCRGRRLGPLVET